MKKYGQVANFNIVFGETEQPMLDYFDNVIYPAFKLGVTKESDENEYLFKNVKVLEGFNNIYILTGQFVKKTILEIKSDINEEGELIEKDEKYSAAPYSSFAINLMNHRMIYVPNQKGSPTLANFRSSVKFVINHFIKEKNKHVDEQNKIPYALVNIVGIPSVKTMDTLLKDVEKINKLTLRFYPLNGDLDVSGVFEVITQDMRAVVGSKNGEIVFKSPKSMNGVIEIIEKAAGTIATILHVTTKAKSKITIKEDQLSEKYELDFNDNIDLEGESLQIINKMSTIDSMVFSNNSHQEIYERNKEKIIPFVKKVEGDENRES